VYSLLLDIVKRDVFMLKNELIERYILFVIGLFIMAFGVALSTKATLGTSPISCVPYVLSLGLPLTMGEFTFIMHIVFIIAQIILLRREFELIQVLQLIVAVVFSIFTDFTMYLVSGIQVNHIIIQWLLLLLSCIILAFGISIEVTANVLILAGEGVILAISRVFHKDFGRIKICFDFSLVVIGIIISFYLFHELDGIREGTIIASLLVGTIARFFIQKMQAIDVILKNKSILSLFLTRIQKDSFSLNKILRKRLHSKEQ